MNIIIKSDFIFENFKLSKTNKNAIVNYRKVFIYVKRYHIGAVLSKR